MACLIHLILPPPRPPARPRAALGPQPGFSMRQRAPGTVGTILLATLAALSVTLLGGCGGGEPGDEAGTATGTAATAEAASLARSSPGGNGEGSGAGGTGPHTRPAQNAMRQVAVDFRLESEYGPGDAPGASTREVAEGAAERGHRAAVPVDRQAHTRAGRYLSRAVAERRYEETGGHAVWVDAGCCAGLDPDLPEHIAFGMQAVLGDEAPLYVGGSDLRQAARLADRLDALGVGRVYLVTP